MDDFLSAHPENHAVQAIDGGLWRWRSGGEVH
jgi:hypothetical protein